MHSEKEVRYMDRYEAKIEVENDNHFLCLIAGTAELKIPLTEDNPNAVKSVFNDLIVLLKKGKFEFYMTNIEDDLFSQVSQEYITQLNQELSEVFSELNHHGLIEENAESESK